MERAEAPSALPAERFEFGGAGADYFRIWIVNIALTIVTLVAMLIREQKQRDSEDEHVEP
jgi:uncharacterized membrane protein YjgN (DUF898 family)